MADRYAVFGNPVAHSKSPQIHSAFAQQTSQALSYDKQHVEEDAFASAAKAFFAEGGKGLNITVPFKLDAYDFADRLSKRARQAGAVNTLILTEDGSLQGDNTDGVGMVRDITENLGWPIAAKRILVLGAGGAVRGILGPVLAEQPAEVVIANRTASKAEQLATAFSKEGNIRANAFDALGEEPFDLIINGTSASLGGELPPIPAAAVGNDTFCYDMMYGAEDTAFNAWAKTQGCAAAADGLGMLVEQAAESFFLWRGCRPETGEVIAAIRAGL